MLSFESVKARLGMGHRTTVLVVDDIPLMRTILAKYVRTVGGKILEEAGGDAEIEIVEASSGTTALEALRKKSIDLVFLDLMMPEMDGLTFLALKQQDSRLHPIPVVVCSALGEKDTLAKAQELGAVTYLLKPFTVKSVEEKLRQAMGRISAEA